MDKGVPGMDLVTGVLEPDSRLRSSPSVLVDADSLLSREGERDLPQGRDSIGKCICLYLAGVHVVNFLPFLVRHFSYKLNEPD